MSVELSKRAKAKAALAGVPRVALAVPSEAAAALGVSTDHFNRHVRPELRLVRRGRLVLVGVDELARWVERSSERTLEEGDV